jgi:hypothetical protein
MRGKFWLFVRALLLFPDEQVGWTGEAVRTGLQLLRGEGRWVLLSSSPPETCHLAAVRLKRRTGVPWVADLRDPWSFSHLRPRSALDLVHRLIERRTLRRADALVTVTQGWGRRLQALHPGVPCHVIPNGHDGAAITQSPPSFRITYTGKIDLVEQDPTPLIEGIRRWLETDLDAATTAQIRFHTYGDKASELRECLRRSGLEHVAGDTLDHSASLAAQADSSVLVLFAWRSDPDCVPAKLFEYLAARRAILVIGRPESEVARIVLDAGAGAVAPDAAEVQRVLTLWHCAWKTGAPLPGASPTTIEEHNFSRRADEYDSLLRDVIGRASGGR